MAAIEPKTGKRFAHIRRHRGKKEFTLLMKSLAFNYPNADKIVVILDNLNTHNFSGFYETLSAEEASELAQRFEFVYIPKSASCRTADAVEHDRDRILSIIKTMLK